MRTAVDAALTYLAGRALTRAELNQRLIRKGYTAEEIEEAIVRLKEWGYLDDEKYAESYIQTKQRTKSSGKIEFDLKRRGIDEETVERLVSEFYQTEDELALCLKVGEKLWQEESKRWESSYQFKKSYARIPRVVLLKQKVGQKLMQRGFSTEMLVRVLDKLLGRD